MFKEIYLLYLVLISNLLNLILIKIVNIPDKELFSKKTYVGFTALYFV